MLQNLLKCDDIRCELLADDFFSHVNGNTNQSRFNNVIADIVKIYPDAILIGAIAVAKYVRYPVEPRMTYDVDILLPESDFEAFLKDEMARPICEELETHFADSDSVMHSMKHRRTGIYVDFLSVQSKPVKKKLIRRILNHRSQTTNFLKVGGTRIDILKPEYLIAMKLNRYNKSPTTEKGLSDRLDIVKVLKTLACNGIAPGTLEIEEYVNKAELKRFHMIADGVACEIGTED